MSDTYSKQLDNIKYRKLMLQFFNIREWSYKNSITRIESTQLKDKSIVLEVETHMPGMLIGKGGRFIDDLTVFLREETGEDIQLRLVECKLWMNLYN